MTASTLRLRIESAGLAADAPLGDGANPRDLVSVVLNNGDGTFVPAVNIPVGDLPLSVDAVDLDGDSVLDLAVVAVDPFVGPAVQVLENQLDGATVVFAPPIAFSVGANLLAFGTTSP